MNELSNIVMCLIYFVYFVTFLAACFVVYLLFDTQINRIFRFFFPKKKQQENLPDTTRD